MKNKNYLILIIFILIFQSTEVHSQTILRCQISSGPPKSFHPFDAGTELITNYLNQIFDTLTHIDVNGKLQPRLAVSWERIGDHIYRFNLRKGVYFHNGERFDADAVIYTFNYFLKSNTKVDNRFYWGPIHNIKKVNDYSIEIRLSKSDSLFPFRLATVGHILPPKYHKKYGRKTFSLKPIGTGPFVFSGFKPDAPLKYIANVNYWQGKPQIDEIEFHFSESVNEAVQKLIKGELDFVSMVPGHKTFEIARSGVARPVKAIGHNSVVIVLNSKKEGILQNFQIRKSLSLGLNFSDVIKYGYSGNGRVAETLTHDGELFHPMNMRKPGYDIIKAKELLRQNNVKKGQPLKIFILKPLDDVGGIIEKQLEKLGFDPDIEYGSAEEEKKAVLYPNIEGNMPEIDMLISICSHRYANGSFPMLILTHSGGTWSMTHDPELDALLNNAVTASTEEAQIKYFKNASKYISDNHLIIPGFQLGEIYGLNNNFSYKPHVTGYVYFENVTRRVR